VLSDALKTNGHIRSATIGLLCGARGTDGTNEFALYPFEKETEQSRTKNSQDQGHHCPDFQSTDELIELGIGHTPEMPLNPCQA
jgi:hypothetical protein